MEQWPGGFLRAKRAKPGTTPGLRLVQGSEGYARDNTHLRWWVGFRKELRGYVQRGLLRGTVWAQ
jgi:hypothetical protein